MSVVRCGQLGTHPDHLFGRETSRVKAMDQSLSDDQRRARKVRRFTIAVSLAMIILCNAIVLVGLWASGINLDELVTTPMYSTQSRIFVFGSAGSPLRERLIRYLSAWSGSIYPIRPARLIRFNGRSSFGMGRTGSIMWIGGSTPTIGCSYWCWLSWQSLRSGWWRNGIWSDAIGCVSNPPPATGHHSSIELD